MAFKQPLVNLQDEVVLNPPAALSVASGRGNRELSRRLGFDFQVKIQRYGGGVKSGRGWRK